MSYVGGAWSDKLALSRCTMNVNVEGLLLVLHVAVRTGDEKNGGRAALREFVENRERVEFIRVGKPGFVKRLRERVRLMDNADIGILLRAQGHEVRYPAAIVFGPDAITLHLG